MTLERVTPRTDVHGLWPLVAAYLEAVPTDPWADRFEAFRVEITKCIGDPAFLLLLGRNSNGNAVGWLLAEIKHDPPTGTLVAIIHAVYVEPKYQSRGLRRIATFCVEEWARSLGATHIGCLAERGRATERLTGWKFRGSYLGRDFLVGEIPKCLEAVG